jgi:hypothetical protein
MTLRQIKLKNNKLFAVLNNRLQTNLQQSIATLFSLTILSSTPYCTEHICLYPGVPCWLAAGQAPGNVPIWDKISVSRIATGMYNTCKRLFYNVIVEYDINCSLQCLCCPPHQ